MQVSRTALMVAALAASVFIATSGSADAACFRKCTSILSSGVCSNHDSVCEPVEASVGKKLKPLRDGMRCRTQGLLCDYTGCKAVCGAPPKKKK